MFDAREALENNPPAKTPPSRDVDSHSKCSTTAFSRDVLFSTPTSRAPRRVPPWYNPPKRQRQLLERSRSALASPTHPPKARWQTPPPNPSTRSLSRARYAYTLTPTTQVRRLPHRTVFACHLTALVPNYLSASLSACRRRTRSTSSSPSIQISYAQTCAQSRQYLHTPYTPHLARVACLACRARRPYRRIISARRRTSPAASEELRDASTPSARARTPSRSPPAPTRADSSPCPRKSLDASRYRNLRARARPRAATSLGQSLSPRARVQQSPRRTQHRWGVK
mmetsp:Transcript_4485/g.14661  ORF Transcript_4485/g.14661 Transcript_4485/m.14661 type:complete len:283 (-) Transcript_4485:98-946(-)